MTYILRELQPTTDGRYSVMIDHDGTELRQIFTLQENPPLHVVFPDGPHLHDFPGDDGDGALGKLYRLILSLHQGHGVDLPIELEGGR